MKYKSFEKFLELSKDLLVIGNIDGTPRMISSSWTHVLGWSLEEVYAKKAIEFIHPDDLPRTIEVVEKALSGQDIFHFENRYRHKNGSWIPLLWTASFDRENQQIYAMAKDITEIKKIEEQLRVSESRLIEAQRIANIGSWELEWTDPKTFPKAVYWSDEVFRILGYEPGQIEISGEAFLKAAHPDDQPKIIKAIEKSLRTGESVDIEHRIVRPDGSERIVQGRTNVAFSLIPGQPNKVSGTIQDITEQKKLIQQLIAAQKMESLGRLTGGISHDFNNLLAAIFGNLEMMERFLGPQHPAYTYLKNVSVTSSRAADLTKQLLAFSRKQIMPCESLDVNQLVTETYKILVGTLGTDIKIHLSLSPQLPRIYADSGQIMQIILNLTINAKDAMPNGGSLIIETFSDEKFVKLKVSDTGTGMDAATKERLFEPFFTTKAPGHGTGLGLSTVYGIVQQCGGHIHVESEPKKGSSFEISFPLENLGFERQLEPDINFAPSIPVKGLGQRILLIEDEPELRDILRETLEKDGYRVAVADSHQSGQQLITDRTKEFDLLLTDVLIPGGNGIDLIKIFHKYHPQGQVICISGYASYDLKLPQDFQAINFLRKPFRFSHLLQKIENIFSSP